MRCHPEHLQEDPRIPLFVVRDLGILICSRRCSHSACIATEDRPQGPFQQGNWKTKYCPKPNKSYINYLVCCTIVNQNEKTYYCVIIMTEQLCNLVILLRLNFISRVVYVDFSYIKNNVRYAKETRRILRQ